MRYLPLTAQDRQDMLAKIGVTNIDALFCAVPKDKLLKNNLNLPLHANEAMVERHMGGLAARNLAATHRPFFLGCGAYKHHIPATVDHLIQRSEFLTSYTPYQPEVSQGTLQVLFEFQTQVARLTGMDVANASMYDGSTATAEAVLMAHRLTKRRKALLSGGLHPHYAQVVQTISEAAQDEAVILAPDLHAQEDLLTLVDETLSCVVVQNPDVFGHVRDLRPLAAQCHAKGVLLICVFTEVISLGLLRSPGSMGADIVVGEGQSLGNPLSFGGPYVGLFATRHSFLRQMPGRIAGETVDIEGKRSFVLTLSTREQHIRREKATSNICTNSGLCALAFSIHLSLLGGKGLEKLARLNHIRTLQLAKGLARLPNIDVLNTTFFNEISVRLKGHQAERVVERLAHEHGILAGVPAARLWPHAGLEEILILANTEVNTQADHAALLKALGN